jgi:hypothetical protein
MRHLSWGAALAVGVMGLAAVDAQAALTDGWTRYSASYKIQNRTSASLSQRFSFSNGMYTTRVQQGEERVELRWAGWPSQTRDNMWTGDIWFSAGTQKTAIMQIKSNTGGEPIYLQVTTSGTIRNNGDGTPLATGMAETWFNWKAHFNPATGVSKAYINDQLKKTRQYNTGARDWYFKNGTYNNGRPAGFSEARFRNIQFWRK